MESIAVEYRLYASLMKWRPESSGRFRTPAPVSLEELAGRLGVPDSETVIVILNGKREFKDRPLADGDRVEIFPLIGGG